MINPNASELANEHPCETGHCTTAFTRVLQKYLQAKCDHDFTAMQQHLHPQKAIFGDAVCGWVYRTPIELEDAWGLQVPNWPDGARFYATRVIGGDHGGVVFVVDTPEMMGMEIRGVAVVDFEEGSITRWIDYWDSRPLGPERAAALRTHSLPDDLGENTLAPVASTRIHRVSAALQDALRADDIDLAGSLFALDAVFEDHTLRTRIHGRAAITEYLRRAATRLPYGTRSTVRHAVGSDLGGGYEWRSDSPVAVGVSALELDPSGLIELFAAVWDGGTLDDEWISSLAALAVGRPLIPPSAPD